MKSASKQFPACSKSSWQVSTFDSPHNPQNVRLSSNHTPNFRNTQLRLPGESLYSHITHQSGFEKQPNQATCLQAFVSKSFHQISTFPPRSPLDCPQLFNQQPNAALVRGSMSAWLRRRFAANISTRTDCKWKIEVNGPCFVARMPLMTWLEKLYLVRGRQWRLHRSPLRNDLISRTTAMDGTACPLVVSIYF